MTELLEDAFDNFCTFIQNLVTCLIQFMFQGVLAKDVFTPSVDTFKQNFGGDSGFQVILDYFMKVGAVLLFTLLGIRILILLLGNVVEIRDSIVTTVIRLVVCIALIMGIGTVGEKILSVGQNLVDDAVTAFGDPSDSSIDTSTKYGELGASAPNGTSILADSSSTVKQGDSGSSGVTGDVKVDASSINSGQIAGEFVLFVFKAIFRVVFFVIIAYNILKLIIEMVQRYITMIVLYIGMPCGAAFFISSDTQNVFFTYMKMFISQVFVLVFTKVWISLSPVW